MAYGVSKASQYAVRALVFLAAQAPDDVVPVREIAEQEGIPHHFLAKLVGTLVQDGMVEAFKGPGGGLRLAVSPAEINVAQVIETIDGPNFLQGCFLGFPQCGDDDPCPMHEQWGDLRARMIAEMERITIAQLAETLRHLPDQR
jgi:Rrf2 family protein